MNRKRVNSAEFIMGFWVYILRCSDGSYYTGHSDNLDQRIAEHQAGTFSGCYTFDRRPLTLVFCEEHPRREDAIEREQQIKKWSRKKKEALIRGNWEQLIALSKASHHLTAHGSTSSPRTVK